MSNHDRDLSHGASESRSIGFEKPRPGKVGLRGYLRGSGAAAVYCGIGRKAFRSWRDDPCLPDHLRRLLAPRIIRGDCYYRIANLDRFMDPINNVEEESNGFRGDA
jgi:hypothetical protein